MAETSSNQEMGYTSVEIICEKTLQTLNNLEARVRDEEKNEDFKNRHPLNGAIFNLHFVDSVIQPIVAELFTRTGVKKVDLNTWRVSSGAKIGYLQDVERAIDGVNFIDLFDDIKTTPEGLQKAWDMQKRRNVISNFGKQKRSDLIHKFQSKVKKSTR